MRAELISAIESMRASESDVVTWAELKAMLTSAVNSFVVPSDISLHALEAVRKVVASVNFNNKVIIDGTSNQYVTVTSSHVTINTGISYQEFITPLNDGSCWVSFELAGKIYHNWNLVYGQYLNVMGELHLQLPIQQSPPQGEFQILQVKYVNVFYIHAVDFNVASAYYYNMGGVGTGNLGAI